MHILNYLELCRLLEDERDLESLRQNSLYLLVDRCLEDPQTSKLEAETFAEYVYMSVKGNERLLH
jgi:hypothetical protein